MELILEDVERLGYERPGDNGVVEDRESSVLYQTLKPLVDPATGELNLPDIPADGGFSKEKLTKMFYAIGKPYIEGAFMTKHGGRYYLQYACPGTQYNTYADGVYVGDGPLGPFARQASNPFSSKPGGFITGAGHGSTIADEHGNYWHASTMRISVNHAMERRVGLFPAGFDGDGVLFCNQNFADYPVRVPAGKFDPWAVGPEWMLLSYQAIQVNLADEGVALDLPEETYEDDRRSRHIELEPQVSHYTVEVSLDGVQWQVLEDVARECSNGYYEYPEGVRARYVRVVGGSLPYGQALRVSGLRVFGNGDGEKPAQARAAVRRAGPLDGLVRWEPIPGAQGCNVRYGAAPDKLYQSWLVYGANEVKLSTLIAGQRYFVRVDSFNENGITTGQVILMTGEEQGHE